MIFQDAIVEFGFDCKVRKLSPKSITNYQKQVITLRPEQIHDEYILVHGKGSKERLVPVSPYLAKVLMKYAGFIYFDFYTLGGHVFINSVRYKFR